jgi:hypothetical protein
MKPIEMPADLRSKFRFTAPLYGGPKFDFPAQGLKNVDMSQLTERQARTLLTRGWTGIAAVAEKAPAVPEKAEK